jgi:D-alanine transaminase
MEIVYLNGEFLPQEKATVSVNDRGFLFSDGIYEVTPAYRGRFFLLDRHRERLLKGMCELRIDADLAPLAEVHDELLRQNGLAEEPVSIVYLQITRGVAPRTHAFPPTPVAPTVYAFAKAFHRPTPERWKEGFRAVTVPDRRWARVDIKTVSLLGNVLAQQAAVDAGVDDAILVRDGVALEGAHSNLFAVLGDTLVTHPLSNVILPGITRGYILQLAREMGIPTEERPVQVEELRRADEAFFTGTTTEVKPCVAIDGEPVGEGRPGPITARLSEAFIERTDRHASQVTAAAGD